MLCSFVLSINANSLTYSVDQSQLSSESGSSDSSEEMECSKCDLTFCTYHSFLKHVEDDHARKKRKRHQGEVSSFTYILGNLANPPPWAA